MQKTKLNTILVTAGPTIEPIDPVRYISNYSTGEMGFAITKEAAKRGYKVLLIAGPTKISAPKHKNIKTIYVKTTEEMKKAVENNLSGSNSLIMTAAVCDYKPKKVEPLKIKKQKNLSLDLVKTSDILKGIKKNSIFKIGFALETDKLRANAETKLKAKKLDVVIANKKTKTQDPFGIGKKEFTIIYKNKEIETIKNVTKKQMAKKIIDIIENNE